jgi:hypothetical protein
MSKASVLFALGLLAACGAEGPPTGVDVKPELGSGRKPQQGSSSVTIVDLGFSAAFDIDNAGRVVGWQGSSGSGPFRSVLWDPATRQATDLGTLGGSEAYALAINEALQIAGSTEDARGFRPAVWDAGTWRALPDADGPVGGAAEDISDGPATDGAHWAVGEVSGWSVPAIWRVTGAGAGFTVSGPFSLPVPNAERALALAVNASGTAAGYRMAVRIVSPTRSDTSSVPAAWTTVDGASWQASALPLPAGQTSGSAVDVNAAGTLIGYSSGPLRCDEGLVWAVPAATPTPLSDLAGGTCALPMAINDAGYITGFAQDAQRRSQAVLWIPQGSGYTIKALGRLKGTTGAGGRGLNEPRIGTVGTKVVEVVGYSAESSGRQRATLWRVTVP